MALYVQLCTNQSHNLQTPGPALAITSHPRPLCHATTMLQQMVHTLGSKTRVPL
jgi:hypothetical protein